MMKKLVLFNYKYFCKNGAHVFRISFGVAALQVLTEMALIEDNTYIKKLKYLDF